MRKTRSVVVACLLGMLQPGLGFLYVGKPLAAIFVPLVSTLIVVFAAWTKLIFQPWTISLLFVPYALVWLASVVACGITAFRQKEVVLSRYQRWYVYAGVFVVCSMFGFLFAGHRGQWFGFETYRLPSSSMTETFQPGDFVVVDSWAYKHGRTPTVGDVVILEFGKYAPAKFQRRVIGLPGDFVDIENGTVSVNGVQLIEPYVSAAQNRTTSQTNLKYRVPDESYFVLGDNRDASRDSREEGAVSIEAISGKVKAIWLSYDANKGINFDRVRRFSE